MGYRSDVGLCLTKLGRDIMDLKLAGLKKGSETERLVTELFQNPYAVSENGEAAWLWESQKWYSNYPEVEFV